jgi:hypothetical protein
MKTLTTVLFVAFATASAAHAGWEAKFSTKVGGGEKAHEMHGRMRMQGDRTRVDMAGQMPMSMIFDSKTKKSWVLMHAQKVSMEGDANKVPGVDAAGCGTANVDKCLASKGFRKTGTETVDGHACAVYEGKVKGGKENREMEMKIWRPETLKEVPAIKVVGKGKDGTTFETYMTEVKVGSQDASLFSVPKDYRAMGNPMDLMKKGMPGAPGH